MLVGTRDGRIDRNIPIDHAHGVCPGQQGRQDLVPGPVACEAAVPLPHRLPRTELRRQVPPRNAGPVAVDDPLDHQPVIREPTTPPPVRRRHEVLDQVPLGVRERLQPRHAITLTDADCGFGRHALAGDAVRIRRRRALARWAETPCAATPIMGSPAALPRAALRWTCRSGDATPSVRSRHGRPHAPAGRTATAPAPRRSPPTRTRTPPGAG